jgi:hypothetical protein
MNYNKKTSRLIMKEIIQSNPTAQAAQPVIAALGVILDVVFPSLPLHLIHG